MKPTSGLSDGVQFAALWEGMERIRRAIRERRIVLLFLDFDGTLVPITDRPFAIVIPPSVQQMLAMIHNHPQAKVAVVSGRDLADLRPRVGVEELAYAGNHGLEMSGPGWEFVEPRADRLRGHLAQLLTEVADEVRRVPGAWVQNKDLSASVHYRDVAVEHHAELQQILAAHVSSAPHHGVFILRSGKMVLEIRPNIAWHKGTAIDWLTPRLAPTANEPLRIVLGDDTTDEDAFQHAAEGVTILVGRSDRYSTARYRLESPDRVAAFLAWLQRELSISAVVGP
jgi:trehalose 6-phosphate phosphatase